MTPGLIAKHGHRTLAGTRRDVGGPGFARRMAIDRGIVALPRLFPAGAAPSRTSEHGDFRFPSDPPRMPRDAPQSVAAEGVNAIADGMPEVQRRTREPRMTGATRIEIKAGVGAGYVPERSCQDKSNIAFGTDASFNAAGIVTMGRMRSTSAAGCTRATRFTAPPARRDSFWRCRDRATLMAGRSA